MISGLSIFTLIIIFFTQSPLFNYLKVFISWERILFFLTKCRPSQPNAPIIFVTKKIIISSFGAVPTSSTKCLCINQAQQAEFVAYHKFFKLLTSYFYAYYFFSIVIGGGAIMNYNSDFFVLTILTLRLFIYQ